MRVLQVWGVAAPVLGRGCRMGGGGGAGSKMEVWRGAARQWVGRVIDKFCPLTIHYLEGGRYPADVRVVVLPPLTKAGHHVGALALSSHAEGDADKRCERNTATAADSLC